MDKLFSVLRKNKTFNAALFHHRIQAELEKNWRRIFGELSDEFQFVSYRDRTLVVETENPCWRTEINHLKPQVLKNISDVFGKGKVTMFHVKLSTENSKNNNSNSTEKTKKVVYLNGSSFEEKIATLNSFKQKNGYVLCENCHKIYDKTPICRTCSSQLLLAKKTKKNT